VALLTLHHIASDGWSIGVLVRELGALYAALREGRPSPLAELPVQYADFAAWQRRWLSGERLEAELAFWRERLAGAPPALELPTDRPHPAAASHRGASLEMPLGEAGDLARLAELSRRQGTTLFMTLLAAFSALLARIGGQEDVTVGTPIAGRTQEQTEGLIGFFVNTLALRIDLAGEPSFLDLLARVRETTLAAYAHQELPFERLVEELSPERDRSRPPLVQVMLAVQNAPGGALELPGLELQALPVETGTAKLELTFVFAETADGLAGTIEYSRDLFDRPTIARLAAGFGRLLAGAVADPAARLPELPLLGAAERQQVVLEHNDTAGALPEGTLYERFAAQAARHPGRPAVVCGPDALTYAALDAEARRLALVLLARGIAPEEPVALCLDRSPAVLVAILGVIAAGGAYMPFDLAVPRERLARLWENAGRPLILSERRLAPALALDGAEVLCLDELGSVAAGEVPPHPTGPEGLAYVLHTSGSTGSPKGVCCNHRGVLNLLADLERRQPLPAGSRGSLWTSLSFDVSVYEIFSPLLAGGAVHIVPEEVRQDTGRFLEWLERERIESAYVPPFLVTALRERLEAEPEAVPLRRLLVGVEPIPEAELARIAELRPGLAVINGYGPTEATICATLYDVAPRRSRYGGSLITPIGRPVLNSGIHLLDRWLRPVPEGAAGELCIGGAGLARGYLGRPAATAERFVPHPWGAAGERLYRTGDRVRQLPGGYLEFIGRIDHQIKLRGFRIEPAEIEAALREHPEVSEAVVGILAPSAAAGEGERREGRRLAAYWVSAGGPRPGDRELRDFLSGRLPAYMVPAAFVMIPALPLTPSGKIDRKALPAYAPESSTEAAAPLTPVEELVAGIFAEVLRAESVDASLGFFELGGHSLLAAQVVSRVRQVFGVELPLRALFESPTVQALAAEIATLGAGGQAPSHPLVRVEREELPPLSFTQERLWFLQQLEPGSATYNMPVAVELAGDLRVGALQAALAGVVRRHESLRTTFTLAEGALRQRISPSAGIPLPFVDLSALPAPAGVAEAERLDRALGSAGFDLERGPLAAWLLVRLAADRHRFLLSCHHIISDGWSIGVLVRELGALYAAWLEGRPSPLPELPVQYADFAYWQRARPAAQREEELAYWEKQLGGEVAPVELPSDRPRPAIQTFRGGRAQLALTPELTARLRRFSRDQGLTMFMTLLAATQALLSRHSGEQDIPVGAPVAGRERVETEGLIGCFLNTLVLRTDLSGRPGFRELAARVRAVTLGAYSNQSVPFEEVLARLRLQRDLSRTPLFQVLFNMLNLPSTDAALPGLDLRLLTPAEVPSKFDMTFYVSESDARVWISLVYNADLFDEPRMADVLGQLERLLAQAVERPEEPVDGFSLVTGEAALRLPDPAAPLDAGWLGAVHELFAARAEQAPERPAVVDGGTTWSYGDLLAGCRGVAGWLAAHGAGPGDVVAVFAHRSAPVVQAVMGVLAAGAAFTMLDPAYPAPRQVEMLRLARPRAWIALEAAGPVPDAVGSWLEEAGCARLELPAGGFASLEKVASHAAAAPRPRVGPRDLACIGFTSGSTGGPKGVLGLHGSLSHFLPIYCGDLGLGAGDRFTLLSGLAHDPLQRDIFTPLYLGATICVPDPADIGVAGRLAEWMAREGVTVSHLTPALGQLLTEKPPGGEGVAVPDLRVVALIGEALTRRDVARLRELAPGVTCVNLYGATETQRALAVHRVSPAESEAGAERARQVLPLGRGTRDVQLLVIHRAGGLCGVGELGEVVVRSPHLAGGYLGDEALTAQRFQLNPFTGEAGDRVYRTGDLGRYLPDGEVAFAGRADLQVKLRGFRIELGEIEAALAAHPAVREAVVLLREDLPGGRGLAAYVVPEAAGWADTAALHDDLWRRLPSYMVPSAFVVLESMPLTPNGKIDRKSLARHAPDLPAASAGGERAPRTPVEEIVAGLWSEVLGRPVVGPDESFFQLGGHSLSGVQVVSRLREALQVDLPLRTLFEAPTVALLAAEIERRRRPEGLRALPTISSFRQDRSAPPPLSFAQERFWTGREMERRTVAPATIPIMVHLEGPLDLLGLRRALQEIVDRHEVLRTSFREEAGRPVQVVHAGLAVHLPVIDLEALPPQDRLAEIQRLSALDRRTHFDYERAPLFRLSLFRCAERESVLLFTIHHIAFDGWSRSVLLGELAAVYNAFREGLASPLRPLPAQYQDFARWQRQTVAGEALERQVAFWRHHLQGASSLDLAGGRPRPAVRTFEAGVETFTVPPELERRLEAFAAERCVTLFMTLLTAFNVVLREETGVDDIVIICLFANRNQVEVESLIGNFYAGLPLRTRSGGARTFRGLLERVRDVTLAASENPDILYEPVFEGMGFQSQEGPGGLDTFRVLFQLGKLPPAEQTLSDLKLTRLPVENEKMRKDLSLFLTQSDGLVGRFRYNRDVLDPERVARMRDRFLQILASAVAEPELPLPEAVPESVEIAL
jgi:amino acid adenylation domain-containing protein